MERIYSILDLLKVKKQLSIEELCEKLYCSPATIRRDIVRLENMKAAKKVRGGVVLIEGTNFDYSAKYRNAVNQKEKEYICGIARDFISPGMSLFMDSSSTAIRMCPILAEIKNITVITNGVDTALMLNECDNVDTYITGGNIKKGTHTVLGEPACDSLDGYRADLAIISCRGVDETGIYDADISQKYIKTGMMRNADKTILLCDSSKFGHIYFHRLCKFEDVEAVISDRRPEEKYCKAILDSGADILY